MDTARQILRYSIPGSLCIITVIAVVSVLQVAARFTLTALDPALKLQTTVALIAASIPIGFVLYQMYYSRYGPFVTYGPFSRLRHRGMSYVSRDRGADVLQALPPERLDQLRDLFGARLDVRTWYPPISDTGRLARFLRLPQLDEAALRAAYPLPPDLAAAPGPADGRHAASGSPLFPNVEEDPRCVTRIYHDNWYENWSVFRSLLDLVSTRADARELKAEFTTLSDIYHALGAARNAVALGGIIGAGYMVAVHSERLIDHPFREIVASLGLLICGMELIRLLHQARQATWKSALACAHYGLCWCFETHPKLLEHLDGRKYEFLPRMHLRRLGNTEE